MYRYEIVYFLNSKKQITNVQYVAYKDGGEATIVNEVKAGQIDMTKGGNKHSVKTSDQRTAYLTWSMLVEKWASRHPVQEAALYYD